MQKLWTRYFFISLIISLAIMTGHYMLITSLPAFLASIGGSAADAGVLGGVFTLAALVSRPFLGKAIDARGRRIVLISGSIVILLASAVYPFLAVIPLLVILRVFHGFGFSAFTTALNTAMADIVPSQRLSEGLSYIGIAGTIATAFGPVIGLGLAGRSFGIFFATLALLSLAGIGGSGLMNYENRVRCEQTRPSGQGKLFEKSALRCSIVLLLMCLPLDAVMIFISSYGAERGFSQIHLFFPVHAIAMLLSRLTLGRLADRIGPNFILLPSMAMGIFSFILLAFARTDTMMIIASFVFGIPMGIAFTILHAILIRTSPRDSLGAANATMMAFADIGFGVGSIVMGLAIEHFGFTVFFLLGAACFLLSVLSYIYLLWNRPLQNTVALAAAE